MTIPVADTGGRDFEPVPEGIHQAICIGVADLGAQQTTWQGQTKMTHQVWINWELPNTQIEYERDGQNVTGPMSISSIYTASLSQKANLRKHLEAWRGRQFSPEELQGFDLTAILGTMCQLQVQHVHKGDKTYANVIAVVGLPPGTPAMQPHNEKITYAADDTAQFAKLPKWIQDKIQGATPVSSPVPGAPAAPQQQQMYTPPAQPTAPPPYPPPVGTAQPPAPPAPPATNDFDDDIPF